MPIPVIPSFTNNSASSAQSSGAAYGGGAGSGSFTVGSTKGLDGWTVVGLVAVVGFLVIVALKKG